MSTVPPNAPTPKPLQSIPETRDFKPSAHQPLLSPAGDSAYYAQESQRAILDGEASLARFLPAASFTPVPRTDQLRGVSSRVAFALGDKIKHTARMLRAPRLAPDEGLLLPRAEIEAFAEAVKKFLEQAAAGGAGGLSPFQQRCRRDFRLPNPELEPDAYWVYGSEFDRRLTILWGCERIPRTSVTLEQAVQYLRTREMAWEDKQELALKLALRPDEKLSRFLGLKTSGGDDLTVAGQTVAAAKIRPFRTLGPGEWRNFDQAASDYLAKAAAESCSPFERELRQEFRLPSLDKSLGSFHKSGSRLLIAVARWPREQTVPPTRPPAATPSTSGSPYQEGSTTPETTLTQQLETRIRAEWVKPLVVGGIAAVLLIGGFFGVKHVLPRSHDPLAFTSIETQGPDLVIATLNEKIAPEQVNATSIFFVNDKPGVKEVKVDPSNPTRLLITPKTSLQESEPYALTVKNLVPGASDESLTSTDFFYYDRVAPTLTFVPVAASDTDGRGLLLRFSKPIDRDSFGGKVKAWPLVNGTRGKTITLSLKDEKSANSSTALVLLAEQPFNFRMTYELSLEGVRDLSQAKDETDNRRGNLLVLPNSQRKTTEGNLIFDYEDLLPPEIKSVNGQGTGTVIVDFDEPVDPEHASDPANYHVSLASDPTKTLTVVADGVRLNPSNRSVTLRLAKTKLSSQPYKVTVDTLTDISQRRNKRTLPAERQFSFTAGQGDFKIEKIEGYDDANPQRLFITFNKALWDESLTKSDRFIILTHTGQATNYAVNSTTLDALRQETVVLNLKAPLKGGGYTIRVSEVEDLFGQKLAQPIVSKEFWIKTVGTTKPIKNAVVTWKGTQVFFRFPGYRFTAESLTNKDNYQFSPAAEIARVEPAKLEQDGDKTVQLITVQLANAPVMLTSASAENLKIEGDPSSYKLPPASARLQP